MFHNRKLNKRRHIKGGILKYISKENVFIFMQIPLCFSHHTQ